MKCKTCGSELVGNAKFCHECGSKVEIAEATENMFADDIFAIDFEDSNDVVVVRKVDNTFETYMTKRPVIEPAKPVESVFIFKKLKTLDDFKCNIKRLLIEDFKAILEDTSKPYRQILIDEYSAIGSMLANDLVKMFSIPEPLWAELVTLFNGFWDDLENYIRNMSIESYYRFDVDTNQYMTKKILSMSETDWLGRPKEHLVYDINDAEKKRLLNETTESMRECENAVFAIYQETLDKIKPKFIDFLNENNLSIQDDAVHNDLSLIEDGDELFESALLVYSANGKKEEKQEAIAGMFRACGRFKNAKAQEHIINKYVKDTGYELLGCTDHYAILFKKEATYDNNDWYNGKFYFAYIDTTEKMESLGYCDSESSHTDYVTFSDGNNLIFVIQEETVRCYLYTDSKGEIKFIDKLDQHIPYAELFAEINNNVVTYGAYSPLTRVDVKKSVNIEV